MLYFTTIKGEKEMKYQLFNKHAVGVTTLSKAKITNFKVKMRVAKLAVWVKESSAQLTAGYEAIGAKFEIDPADLDKDGLYIGKDPAGFTQQQKERESEIKLLLQEECEIPDFSITEDELEAIEIAADTISDLIMMGFVAE